MTDQPTQPPGWYYAQGDPPGTHRYWDGVQWQGSPQAVSATAAAMSPDQNAGPGKRFVAFLIDWGITIGISIVFNLLTVATDLAIFAVLGQLANLGWFVYNWIYLTGTTGQTIGKGTQGIAVQKDGQAPGMGMAFVRVVLQAVFTLPCGLDNWWILIDENNRRLSDRVLDMNVYEV